MTGSAEERVSVFLPRRSSLSQEVREGMGESCYILGFLCPKMKTKEVTVAKSVPWEGQPKFLRTAKSENGDLLLPSLVKREAFHVLTEFSGSL